MKVIDILDRIANGEKLHFCVINEGFKTEYFYEKGKLLRFDDGDDVEWRISEDWLNCEAEIIEEDNIEKVKDINTDYYAKEFYYDNLSKEEITLDIQTLKHKVNEIIDKLNKGE